MKKIITTTGIILIIFLAACQTRVSIYVDSTSKPKVVLITDPVYGPIGNGFFIDDNTVMTAKHVARATSNQLYICELPVVSIEELEGDCAILIVNTPKVEKKVSFASPVLEESILLMSCAAVDPKPGEPLWSRGIVSSTSNYVEFFQCSVHLGDYASMAGQSGAPVLNNNNQIVGMHLGYIQSYSVFVNGDVLEGWLNE